MRRSRSDRTAAASPTGRRSGAARRALTLAFLMAVCVPPALAQQSPPFPIPYDLGPQTRYEEGCFGPCMCPILFQDQVKGGFTLSFSRFERPFILYDVKDIDWSLPQLGKRFTGSGTYMIGWRGYAQQRLQVDLGENGGPPEHFDSGIVPVTAPFPLIDVNISIHGFYCHDKAFYIKAKPARPVCMNMQVDPSDVSWDPFADSPGYDVVFGSLNRLRETGGDFTAATSGCLASAVASSPVTASADPPVGEAFWYLARAGGGVAGMTYDSGDPGEGGTCDARINASPNSCP
jgi:hypothetical protein